MVKREFLIATLVGVLIYITDLTFGWLTFLTGPFPVIFVMAIIIGLIAGTVGDALKATFLTWLLGILLGCLLAPIIFAEFWSEEGFLPMLPIIVAMWSVRGMFIDWQFEGTWFEAIAVTAVMAIVWLVITPILYLMSFLVAAICGFIGRRVHERIRLTKAESSPPSFETPGIQ